MAVYRDVERPSVEEESRTEGIEHVIWARREGEATRVFMRREVAKEILVTEGFNRLSNSKNRTQKII